MVRTAFSLPVTPVRTVVLLCWLRCRYVLAGIAADLLVCLQQAACTSLEVDIQMQVQPGLM